MRWRFFKEFYRKHVEVFDSFSDDITASSVSEILYINRNMINAYYNEIRGKFCNILWRSKRRELGEFELDKVTLEHGRFVVKAGVVQPGKRRCLGCRESVCDGSSELFERRADSHYSRENPGRIDDSHGWLEGLRRPHFERLQPLPSLPSWENLLAENRMSTALSASGVTPNAVLRNSMD